MSYIDGRLLPSRPAEWFATSLCFRRETTGGIRYPFPLPAHAFGVLLCSQQRMPRLVFKCDGDDDDDTGSDEDEADMVEVTMTVTPEQEQVSERDRLHSSASAGGVSCVLRSLARCRIHET